MRHYFAAPGSESDNESDTASSAFPIGCMVKVLTAISVLELCAGGKVDLFKPIGEYLAALRHTAIGRQVSVAHVLSHTGGYPIINSQPLSITGEKRSLLDALQRTVPLFTGGDVYSYQNSGSALLSYIAYQVSHKTTEELIDELFNRNFTDEAPREVSGDPDSVFGIVSGARIHRRPSVIEHWRSAVSFQSWSLANLLDLGDLLLRAPLRRCQTGLAEFTIESIFKPVVQIPRGWARQWPPPFPTAATYGLSIYGPDLFGHDGATLNHALILRVAPSRGLSFCIGIESKNGVGIAMADHISSAFMKALGLSFRNSQNFPIEFRVSDLVGTYFAGPGLSIDVKRDRRGLVLNVPGTKAQYSGKLCSGGHLMPTANSSVADVLTSTLPYSFFKDPSDGTPCVMSRAYAYKMI